MGKWDELAYDIQELIAIKRAESDANRTPHALPAGQNEEGR
jgi:hypothetical protein